MSLERSYYLKSFDPDEYVRKYGPENFKDFVTSHERTELEFYLEYFRVGRNLETESDQLAYITDVLEKVAQVKDPLARDLTLNRLAKEFELDKNNLTSQLQALMQQVQSEQLKQDQANSLKRSDKVVYSTQQRQEKKNAIAQLNKPKDYYCTVYYMNMMSFCASRV